MALSSDSDDLSLKVRKLFPQIEERVRQGGEMAPSDSDYSQITELMDIKRLYEEQEVHGRHRVAVKEEEVGNLQHDMEFLRQQVKKTSASRSQQNEEGTRLRGGTNPLRSAAQPKTT